MSTAITNLTDSSFLERRECIVCGTLFSGRSDKQVCSRKCGIKHQHNKAKEPTRRDRATDSLLKFVSPKIEKLYSEGTHLFNEIELDRETIDEWTSVALKAEWPGKLLRSSKAQSKKRDIISAAQQFIEDEKVMTLRHLHYLLVSACVIKNTVGEYRGLSDVITDARKDGDIPYSAIRDGVRNSVIFDTWENPAEFAESAAAAYRKNIWKTQRDAVEIWFEKDSVISVVEGIAQEYRVTMRPMRGHASASFLYEAAKQISTVDRNLYIYYFGDHDPSGYCIEESARERLIHLLIDEFGWQPGKVADKLRWRRLGFLEDDFCKSFTVNALDAKPSDSNYREFTKRYGTEAAELEALPPHELRRRVTDAIESHLDMKEWKRMKHLEQMERDSWMNSQAQLFKTWIV